MADWNASLCGCLSDLPLCLMTCFLPCIPSGHTVAWVRGKPAHSMLYIVVACVVSWLGTLCCMGCYTRRKVGHLQLRQKYGIGGSSLVDCLLSFFCLCCVVEQNARQIGCKGCSGPTDPVR
eukprot:EG_transcript_19304